MRARYKFEIQSNPTFGQNRRNFPREFIAERKSVILRTPRIPGREGYDASVRAVARFSFSFTPASLFLAISPPTSLKGDGLVREGRRKRVNQAECVPELVARG